MPKENISVTLDPELLTRINKFVESDAGKNIVKDRTELVTKATIFFMDMMENKPFHLTSNRTLVPAEIDRALFEDLEEYCKTQNKPYGHLLELMIAIISPEEKTWFDVGVSAITLNRMESWLNRIKKEMKKVLNGGNA